jgi:hypothetical protein
MIRELLDTYYDGIAKKSGWDRPLADDMIFVGPGGSGASGKPAYVQGTNQFLRAVTGAERREMLVDGETACVWVRYALSSPRGQQGSLDALEIWKASGNQLGSMTLYFDTTAFRSFMQS